MPRRRWLIPLAALAVGLAAGVGATSASAATSSGLPAGIQPGGAAIQVSPGSATFAPRSNAVANETASTNWSGYAATGGPFNSVTGTWVMPDGNCSGTSSTHYSSFWVGLDGWNSKSVEQLGTELDCVDGAPQYSAWWEMFPAASQDIKQTVKAGDTINASVTYQGSNEFKLNLADPTEGWTFSTTQSASGVARSSAEVIIEAPSQVGGGVLPLADFGTVDMSKSTVDGSAIGSHSPTQIYMTDSSGARLDTVSGLSGGEDFSATYYTPATGPVPVLSNGKAVAISPTRETVTWSQTIPSWEMFKIVGPGPINGHVGWVPPGTTTAVYSGLEANHGYTVTYTPYTAKNGSPIAGAKPGKVYFVS
jgi:hypothetical protein